MPSTTDTPRPTRLLYFAWVREKIGRAEETRVLPAELITIADLIGWLKAQGPEYANAFARETVIHAAIDQQHVKAEAKIVGAREIGFFPPVTGG